MQVSFSVDPLLASLVTVFFRMWAAECRDVRGEPMGAMTRGCVEWLLMQDTWRVD